MTGWPLNIAHVFRAPVGGLFRHVRDVVKAQAALGHKVSVVCDSSSGGPAADQLLSKLSPLCAHGIHRMAMSRTPGLGDAISARRIAEELASYDLDIVHGHGAKGGAYARMAAGRLAAAAVYTPHGGTLHYEWKSPQGALFLGAERLMLARTAGLAFVCNYEKRTFQSKIGLAGVPHRVIHNGLWPNEFEPIPVARDASDVLYVGEMRILKGVDTLIEAIGRIEEKPLTATLVGDGPDRAQFETLAKDLQLQDRISFPGAMPARDAFALGRLMIVPSRSESFPYIVLEAVAAGKPIIASNVGGIPEILEADVLTLPDDPQDLAKAIVQATQDLNLSNSQAIARSARVAKQFSAAAMGEDLLGFYRQILAQSKTSARVA